MKDLLRLVTYLSIAVLLMAPGCKSDIRAGDDDSLEDDDTGPDDDSSPDDDDSAPDDDDSAPDDDDDVQPTNCGYEGTGTVLEVTPDIVLCMPETVCAPETCPPDLGTCIGGECVFNAGYEGVATYPEAWATRYCALLSGGCNGVSQLNPPDVTASMVGAAMGYPLCANATGGEAACVGIVASSPMVVGNSEETVDPDTGNLSGEWGLGYTEPSGLCYEVTGPGGTAIVASTDRCGGYCTCNGSAVQECGPCINAEDMTPNCACVGPVPGLFEDCCGMGCPTLDNQCDWCASNNHPHFDLDDATFNWVCGDEAIQGSCQLSVARFVECLEPNEDWPPNAVCPAEDGLWDCGGVSPAPEQPLVPGTDCCCFWGLTPQQDGTCA